MEADEVGPRAQLSAPAGPAGRQVDISRSRPVAHALDDLVRIPGTNMTVGLDAAVGLVPGLGDAATAAMGAVILADAVRVRVPLPVLARMVLNCSFDALLGQLPVVGDLADVAFRSNRMNLRLLERTVADPHRLRRASLAYLAGATALVLAALVVTLGAAAWALWLFGRVLGLW